jgi:hypothetical protein
MKYTDVSTNKQVAAETPAIEEIFDETLSDEALDRSTGIGREFRSCVCWSE